MYEINWLKLKEFEKKKKEEMTEEEWDFYKWMYHIEEYQSGLDGDENE